MAYIAGNRGAIDDVFRHLSIATSVPEATPSAWYYLGVWLAERRRHGEAVGAYRKSLALAGDFVDFEIPVGSLPLAFGTTLATLPAGVPYLAADPALTRAWSERLRCGDGRMRIGIACSGNAAFRYDRRRPIPLRELSALRAWSTSSWCRPRCATAIAKASPIRRAASSISATASRASTIPRRSSRPSTWW